MRDTDQLVPPWPLPAVPCRRASRRRSVPASPTVRRAFHTNELEAVQPASARLTIADDRAIRAHRQELIALVKMCDEMVA